MVKITTVLSPREAMIRIARAWRPLFNDINAHYKADSRGRVILDKKAAADMGIFGSMNLKLKDAFMQQLLNDARIIGEEAKKKKNYKLAQGLLKEIEGLLKSIKRESILRKRQARYLKSLARSLGGNVKRIEREVRREEIRARSELEKTFKTKRKKLEDIFIRKFLREKKQEAKVLKFPQKIPEDKEIKKLVA